MHEGSHPYDSDSSFMGDLSEGSQASSSSLTVSEDENFFTSGDKAKSDSDSSQESASEISKGRAVDDVQEGDGERSVEEQKKGDVVVPIDEHVKWDDDEASDSDKQKEPLVKTDSKKESCCSRCTII